MKNIVEFFRVAEKIFGLGEGELGVKTRQRRISRARMAAIAAARATLDPKDFKIFAEVLGVKMPNAYAYPKRFMRYANNDKAMADKLVRLLADYAALSDGASASVETEQFSEEE